MDGSMMMVESHSLDYWVDECVVQMIWDRSDNVVIVDYEYVVVLVFLAVALKIPVFFAVALKIPVSFAVALGNAVPNECYVGWETFAPGQHMNHECEAHYDMSVYCGRVIHDRLEHYEDAAHCEHVDHSNGFQHLKESKIPVIFSI